MPQRIKVLDRSVTGKIAAGEVVENPSSVVKELMENSIDAGATAIEIEIERGGKDLIRVVDNGTGIEKQDVDKAFLRHATSKLSSEEDLGRLSTLGFRGEALAAIAAVAEVSLLTRIKDSIEGTLYTIDRRRNVELGATGCALGTCIEVRDLFYNTPARKEYLKSDSYEASAVNDIVSRLALARPDIAVRFVSGGRVFMNTPGNGDLRNTLIAVYGRDITDNILRIDCKGEGLRVSGFVSTPHGTRSNRNRQSFFINGRYIRSNTLTKGLEEAYRTLIMVNRYPMAVLYLTLDADTVDVNVHPAKLEVKFKEEDMVRRTVFSCVRAALEKGRWLAGSEKVKILGDISKTLKGTEARDVPEQITLLKPGHSAPDFRFKEDKVEYNRIDMDNNIEDGGNKLPEMSVVGQFLSTFILAEGSECIYLIDQHAAHERIMYERLMAETQKGSTASQMLLEPIVMDLSPRELEAIMIGEKYITSLGYGLDRFGVSSIRIKAVPVFLGAPQSREFIFDLIEEILQKKERDRRGIKQEDIIMMACKKAVKAHQRLSKKEMESLLEQLANTEMPYTCPHGRPVIVTLTRYELEKMFKRIV